MRGRRYIYRCDAGEIPEIGTGHLRRGLLLAKELKQRHGIEISFLMRENAMAAEMVRNSGHPLFTFPGSVDEIRATLQVISAYRPCAIVLDKLDSESRYVKCLKDTGVLVFSMDDNGSGANLSDLVINAIQWRKNGKTPYTGPAYMVLPPVKPVRRIYRDRVEKIFICFGGYDHLDLTTMTLQALKGVAPLLKITVAMKRLSPNSKMVEAFIRAEAPSVRIVFDLKELSELLLEADLAIVNGGLTLFEAMQLGLPCVAIAQYDHQLQTANAAEARGAALSLGKGDEVDEGMIREAVMGLIPNQKKRARIGRKARICVNDTGLRKVADLLAVVEMKAWDMKFFGRRIAMLHPTRLNEALVRYAFKYCREEDVHCLYYLADLEDSGSLELARTKGFDQVDVRLQMTVDLVDVENGRMEAEVTKENRAEKDILVRPAIDKDGPLLKKIVNGNNFPSRFFADQNFSDEECRKLYRVWIRKSLQGRFGQRERVFVAEFKGSVVGFISCDFRPPSTGLIVLVCVSSKFRNNSIGITMVRKALNWMANEGLTMGEVVTQERNIAAQALYRRAGFRVVDTKVWYHKWF